MYETTPLGIVSPRRGLSAHNVLSTTIHNEGTESIKQRSTSTMEAHALVLPSMTKKGGDVRVVVHVMYLEPQ